MHIFDDLILFFVVVVVVVSFDWTVSLASVFCRVDLVSRNTFDVVFRVVELGVALWFPCVLWNCIR